MSQSIRNQTNHEGQQGPRFGTILVARSNQDPPSEMEIHLRSQSQKLKVCEKLSGAHLLLPVESIAVRIYYPADIKRWDEHLMQEMRPSNAQDIEKLLEALHSGAGSSANSDVDGLAAFRKSFKFTVVMCVMPEGTGSIAYLNRPDSFIHRVQDAMCGFDDGSTPDGGNKSSRVSIVPDTETAVTTLILIADALKPDTRKKKEDYFERQREVMYIPDRAGVIPRTHGAYEPSKAAITALNVLLDWARDHNVDEGEASVLMAFLGTLGAIATASDSDLKGLPIENKTKAALHAFFGSKGNELVHRQNNLAANGIGRKEIPPMIHTDGEIYQSPMVPIRHPIETLRSLTHLGSTRPSSQYTQTAAYANQSIESLAPVPARGGFSFSATLGEQRNSMYAKDSQHGMVRHNGGIAPPQLRAVSHQHQQQQQPFFQQNSSTCANPGLQINRATVRNLSCSSSRQSVPVHPIGMFQEYQQEPLSNQGYRQQQEHHNQYQPPPQSQYWRQPQSQYQHQQPQSYMQNPHPASANNAARGIRRFNNY